MSEKYSVSRQQQISGIIIAFVVCVLCLLVVVSKKAFASNSYTQAVKLADATWTDVYLWADVDEGTFYDKCSAKFWFVEEYNNFSGTPDSEVDAILCTFPQCKMYKMSNYSDPIHTYNYSTSQRGPYNHSDNWCYLSYGTRLKVTIATWYGNLDYTCSESY